MPGAKRFLIRGQVQGVGYRYFAQNAADRLGVNGFVRNLPDGDVEVHAEAGEAALALFKHELEKGPRMASVSEVIATEIAPTGLYSSFLIRG